RSGQSAVAVELDPDQHHQFLRILCAGRYRPQLRQPCAQCFQFAQRQLRRGAVRQAERGRVVEGLAGGGEPCRVALVGQRRDLLGIELGRRWGGLLRRSRQLGVGLFRLGLLGFVLRERVGDRIGLCLGLLFFGLGFGGFGFRRRRRLARGFDFLLFHHL